MSLRFAVAVTLGQHGEGAVGFPHPLEFAHDEVGGLVPRDAFELAHASVLGVPLSIRIPVDPLQRVGDPVGRIDALLIGHAESRRLGLQSGFEGLSSRLHLPGAEGRPLVLPGEVEGTDAQDLAVFRLGDGRTATGAETGKTDTDHTRLLVSRHRYVFVQALHDASAPLVVVGDAQPAACNPAKRPKTRAWLREIPPRKPIG